MRALRLALVGIALALDGVAAADATVPGRSPTESDWLARCTIHGSPLLRVSRRQPPPGIDDFRLVAAGQRHLVMVQHPMARWPHTLVMRGESRQHIASFADVDAAGVVEDAGGDFAGLLELRGPAKTLSLVGRDGKRRWSVPHGYWTDVALSLDGDRVVMRGYESRGCYEQTFDLATGRRLSSRHTRR